MAYKNRLILSAAGISTLAILVLALLGLFRELERYTPMVPLFFFVFVLASLLVLIYSNLITDPASLIFASVLVLIVTVLRIIPLDFKSHDYNTFLSRWVMFFAENGGVLALGEKIGDYNFPYLYFLSVFSYLPVSSLYLIKFLSIVFDLILALYAMKIVSLFVSKRYIKLTAFFAVLLLPTIWVNSALWAQCDSIYTAFGLMALYYALKDRPLLSVVFITLAFSFKLQIIFLMPIYAVFLFTKKVKVRHLFAFPAIYLLLCLPAVLFGRPLLDVITIYTSQVGSYSALLTLNAPSIFAFVGQNDSAPIYSAAGVLLAFASLFILLFYAYLKRKNLNNLSLVLLSLTMVILIPLLLPSMHERYYYLADVLSLVAAFILPAMAAVPMLVQLASWSGYHAYLIGGGIGIQTGAFALIVALVLVSKELILKTNTRRPDNELDRSMSG